jgi:hypothetical protein
MRLEILKNVPFRLGILLRVPPRAKNDNIRALHSRQNPTLGLIGCKGGVGTFDLFPGVARIHDHHEVGIQYKTTGTRSRKAIAHD